MSEKTKKTDGEPRHLLRAHTFGYTVMKATKDEMKMGVDPFDEWYSRQEGDLKILRPPFEPLSLARLRELSDILRQCITAMAVNIEGFGWELKRIDDPTEEKKLPRGAKKEQERLKNFLKHVNYSENITNLRMKTREDVESTGCGYWEVVRDRVEDISELHILPSHSMRLAASDKSTTQYQQKIRGSDGKITTITRNRRFRRFVQNTSMNEKIYFKEFGDPRIIGSEDGKVNGKGTPAHEVIYFEINCPYSTYGQPRWIGQMIAKVNYLFFDNKTIPPLVITVSGGAVTQETLDKLDDVFGKDMKGVENFHKALLLEATPHSAGDIPGEKVAPVRIEVKPLTEYIAKDALFLEYKKSNRNGVRSTFQLPPIFTGDTTDYTKATALMSIRVAEEQIFEPERRKIDYIINNTILLDMDINYWEFTSLGAQLSEDVELVKAMGMVKEGLTVGSIMEAVAKMRGVPIGNIPDGLYTTTLSEHTSGNSMPAGSAGGTQGNLLDDKKDDEDKDEDEDKKKDLPPDKKKQIVKSVGEVLDADVEIIQ
jgi:PBSX family phage portal protein